MLYTTAFSPGATMSFCKKREVGISAGGCFFPFPFSVFMPVSALAPGYLESMVHMPFQFFGHSVEEVLMRNTSAMGSVHRSKDFRAFSHLPL